MKNAWLLILTGAVLIACGMVSPMRWNTGSIPRSPWEGVSSSSNGESIYITATNDQGESIPYVGGPVFGGMMMQPQIACVTCHGADGRGGTHIMHMQVMDAPDIRYVTLDAEEEEHGNNGESMDHGQGDYNLDTFRQAVVDGKHPDGEALSTDMPRWKLSDQDLAALFEYLKSFP